MISGLGVTKGTFLLIIVTIIRSMPPQDTFLKMRLMAGCESWRVAK